MFTPSVDERARVVGNHLFASDAERIGAAAAEGLASGVVLRPEAAGTLSELRVAFDAARLAAWPVFMTGDAGIEDTTLVHLATAWQSGYIKLRRRRARQPRALERADPHRGAAAPRPGGDAHRTRRAPRALTAGRAPRFDIIASFNRPGTGEAVLPPPAAATPSG